MHADRTPSAPAAGTPEHRTQRLVLLELLVDPPAALEPLDQLAARLEEPAAAVRAAGAALAAAGLAVQAGEYVGAAATALYFDALWPIAL
jgi:hypothetical protein